MKVVPGTATRDQVAALRDIVAALRHPLTEYMVPERNVRLVEEMIVDVERSIRIYVAGQNMPGELDPGDEA